MCFRSRRGMLPALPQVTVVPHAALVAAAVAAEVGAAGEGCCDAQSLRGKTPFGVARIARQYHVPVFVLAGTLGEGYADLYSHGIDAAFSIASGPMTLD